jgi:DNA-binding response OmpR family regulator
VTQILDKPLTKKTVAWLEDEIRRLTLLLRPPIMFPEAWGLSRRETQLLAAIYGGGDSPVSLARLIYAIYGDDEPEFVTDCVKVTMFHLRQKMRPHKVRIINVRDTGWHLDRWSREFVRKAIEQK